MPRDNPLMAKKDKPWETAPKGTNQGTSPWTPEMNQRRSEAMKGSENAKKHGHWQRKFALKKRGFGALSLAQRALVRQWRASIIEDLGGLDNVSELKQNLIDRYLQTSILIQSVDQFFNEQLAKGPRKRHPLVNRKRHSLYPIVNERNRLLETSLKLAQAIGLDRQKVTIDIVQELAAMATKSDEDE